MESKRLKVFYISLFFVELVILSVGLINSTWEYSYQIENVISDDNITVGNFQYSEYLPNPEGESAETATNEIVDGQNGFNNPDSSINEAIHLQEIFGNNSFSSVDIWHQNQMRKELGLDDNTNFLIEIIDDNTRIIYTTTVVMGKRAGFMNSEEKYFPDDEYIYPIYRTVSRLNSETEKWESEDAQIGSALPGYYKNNIIVTSIDTPLFDPSTWVAGYKGKSINDPIYIYKNQVVDAVIFDKKIYYKYKSLKNEQITVSILDNMESNIIIYNDQNEKIGNTTNSFSWSAKKNKTYYIEIADNKNVKFKIG